MANDPAKWETELFSLTFASPEEAQIGAALFNSLVREIERLSKDAERLDWLEENHTLHKSIEILYVVDGYEVTVMHEDGVTELSPCFRGNDLRAAIDAARRKPQKDKS